LNIEGAYRVGDWIGLEGGAEGQVIEINWRATKVVSVEQIELRVLCVGAAVGRAHDAPFFRAGRARQFARDGATRATDPMAD